MITQPLTICTHGFIEGSFCPHCDTKPGQPITCPFCDSADLEYTAESIAPNECNNCGRSWEDPTDTIQEYRVAVPAYLYLSIRARNAHDAITAAKHGAHLITEHDDGYTIPSATGDEYTAVLYRNEDRRVFPSIEDVQEIEESILNADPSFIHPTA